MKFGLAAALVLVLGLPAFAGNLNNPDYVVIVKPGTPHTAYDPTTGATAAVAPVKSSALESNHVLKATPGSLFGFQANFIVCVTYPCWVMVFDAASLPGNGAVTPAKWYQASASSTIGVSYSPPLSMTVGAVVGCSTTGPFTLTATAQCAVSGEVQ